MSNKKVVDDTYNTVSIDNQFNFISPNNNWFSDNIRALGHELIKVVVRGIRYSPENDNTLPCLLERPNSDYKISTIIKLRQIPQTRAMDIGGGREFDQHVLTILHNMGKDKNGEGRALHNYTVKTIRIVTRNIENGAEVEWRAKNSSSSTVIVHDNLIAFTINNKKYYDISYGEVLDAAGWMVSKECNYKPGRTNKPEDRCVITGRLLKTPVQKRMSEDIEMTAGK